MHFPNQRDDSSSDDSDDVIPPTPAAKSTPLPRPRKQSSSSNSSSNGGQLETPRFPIRPAAESESSSADEGKPQGTPISRAVNVKREAETDSSSDDEDHQQRNGQRQQLVSRLQPARPVHAMSDSDDSDDEGTSIQLKRQNESSDDSDDNAPKHVRAIVKTEKPSTAESSEEESDDEAPAPGFSKVPVTAQDLEESSSDDETARHHPQKQNAETSSDESDNNDQQKPVIVKAAYSNDNDDSDSSQSNELVQNKFSTTIQNVPSKFSDESSEEDEGPVTKPISSNPQIQQRHINMKESSNEESSDEDVNVPPKSVPPSHIGHQQQKNENQESSDEDSSDEDVPAKSVPPSHIGHQQQKNENQESSNEDSSDEDINVPSKSMPPSRQHLSKPSEESSDEDQEVASKTVFTNQSSQSNSKTAYYDSSDEEKEAEKSEEEEYEKKFNVNDTLKDIKIEPVPEPERAKEVTSREQKPRVVPSRGKYGTALMEETFRESEHVEVKNACLTIEDIGSDDEIWLLQCPKSMDVGALKKKNINLVADSDIQLEDGATFKRFSVTPQQNVKISVNCLLPYQNQDKFQISSFPVKGKVVIQEHIHVPKLRLPEASLKAPVPFPTGLKVRHPLLGLGFEEHIAQVKRTLTENALHYKRNSKKRKHSSGNRSGVDQSLPSMLVNGEKAQTTVIVSNDTNEWSRKKKKKKSQGENESFTESFKNSSIDGSFLNESSAKKQKKSKKDKERHFEGGMDATSNDNGSSTKNNSSSAQNSFSSLDNNSISSRKKKMKSPNEVQNPKEQHQNVPETPRLSWHIPQTEEAPVSDLGTKDLSLKSKKKKHRELLLSTEIKQERNDSCYVNGTTDLHSLETTHSKKRKRKENDESGNAMESTPIPSKKKKYSV